MPSQAKITRNTITWRDRADGGAHGIVTHGLDAPHYVEIDKSGRWALQTLDTQDKPFFVKQGAARSVGKAKQLATEAVVAMLEPTPDDKQHTHINPDTHGVRALKIFIGLALLTLAVLIFGRFLLLNAPRLFARVVFWGGSSLFIAHRLIIWFADVTKRIDYMTTSRAMPAHIPSQQHAVKQEAMRAAALSVTQNKALPRGKK